VGLPFQSFEVGDQVLDLVRVEAELRHGRMTGHNALSQGFLKVLDWVAGVQGAEGRRDRQRAVSGAADGVAAGAIGLHETLSHLRVALGECWTSEHHQSGTGDCKAHMDSAFEQNEHRRGFAFDSGSGQSDWGQVLWSRGAIPRMFLQGEASDVMGNVARLQP